MGEQSEGLWEEVVSGRWAYLVNDMLRGGATLLYEDSEGDMHRHRLGREDGLYLRRARSWVEHMRIKEAALNTARVQVARLAADTAKRRALDLWGAPNAGSTSNP